MTIKIENWNGFGIRFVEISPDEWWAVAKDVAEALGYRMASDMTRSLDSEEHGTHKVRMGKFTRKVLLISEFGVYEAAFNSERPEAKDFKRWVKELIRNLRKASGFEGFQIFRMLDKEHQKEAMSLLNRNKENAGRPDFIKANTIANKAVSSKFGHPKMIKKEQMTPQMLVERQRILEDTVTLITTKENFGLDLSVSEMIYNKYLQ
ncbi:BRO family protein [Paenibacillus sp. FSL E2-0151]|uniref:BRO-N domain-containing protein n=1 Tax=Paenibacillus sp. FSL E2-0151 TaxID=2921357 RepID=UPI0030ED9C1B